MVITEDSAVEFALLEARNHTGVVHDPEAHGFLAWLNGKVIGIKPTLSQAERLIATRKESSDAVLEL